LVSAIGSVKPLYFLT